MSVAVVMSKLWRNLGRGNRVFLAALLLLLQVHVCSAEYQLPDGRACSVCATLEDSHDASLSDSDHGDCHDCCEISACEAADNDAGIRSASPLPTFSLCLTAIVSAPVFALVRVSNDPYGIAESYPPTGPPLLTVSRGPPFFSLA